MFLVSFKNGIKKIYQTTSLTKIADYLYKEASIFYRCIRILFF